MKQVNKWRLYMRCACGYFVQVEPTREFLDELAIGVCPDCGVRAREWQKSVMRWESTATLNPLTWGKGKWIQHDSDPSRKRTEDKQKVDNLVNSLMSLMDQAEST